MTSYERGWRYLPRPWVEEHTYYLLPLCLDAMVNMKESVASWIVAHDYVVRCKLTSKEAGLPPGAYTRPLFGLT